MVRTFLSEDPSWYRLSYPYLVHPGKGFVLTAAIFMIVAISAERYKAVCFPLRCVLVFLSCSSDEWMIGWEMIIRSLDWRVLLLPSSSHSFPTTPFFLLKHTDFWL